jgi:hypothetical protein
LFDASRNVLSLVDYEVDRARHVAGLGRQHLRVVLPPRLPETLADPPVRHSPRQAVTSGSRAELAPWVQ